MSLIRTFLAGLAGASATFNGTEKIYGIQNGGNVSFTPQQLGSPAPFNLTRLGVIGDGVTDNYPIYQSIAQITPTLTQAPKQTATISGADITLNNHGFLQGQPLVFYTTGSLPTGLIAGTTYWVTAAGLALNTFRVSATWPNAGAGPDQTPITTIGPQSGIQSIAALGQDWIDLLLPPGNYVSSSIGLPFTSNGIKRVRLSAYGATTNNLWWSGKNVQNMNTGAFDDNNTALFHNIDSTNINRIDITLITAAETSRFAVGNWVLLMGLDVQGTNSFPPNNHYFEYAQLTSINAGTGTLTFANHRIRNAYRETWPHYGSTFGFTNGGPAVAIAMNPYWDIETEICGLHALDSSQIYGNCRKLTLIDCTFDGQGEVPTFHSHYVAERCTFKQGLEIDKLVEYCALIGCSLLSVNIPSSSINRLLIDGCEMDSLYGTGKLMHIKDSDIGFAYIGPQGAFGASESLIIENSKINDLYSNYGTYSSMSIGATDVLIEAWSFNNGTLSRPLVEIGDSPISFAVPGRKCFISLTDSSVFNLGSPFAILGVRTDGVNFIMDTTLISKPVGNSTNSVVTISITSPAVVTWNLHGLPADTPFVFITSGSLPTGITVQANYYVLAAGLTANTFEFSTSVGGAPVNATGSQSGTHKVIANPLIFLPHPMPRITVRGCQGAPAIADMSDGPPELPMYSYGKRAIVNTPTTIGGLAYVVSMTLWGKLTFLKINVVKAYTGATTPFTMDITAAGFDDSLTQSDMLQTIDLRTVGERIITQTTATGSVGTDVIAAYPNWIADRIFTVASAFIATNSDCPIIEIEVQTDQGITRFHAIEYFDNNGIGAWALTSDTNPNQLN